LFRSLIANPTLFAKIEKRMLHHLMVGTWTPPGAIFTFEFDDEKLSLRLIKRTPIPEDEPISWMTFDVSRSSNFYHEKGLTDIVIFECISMQRKIYTVLP